MDGPKKKRNIVSNDAVDVTNTDDRQEVKSIEPRYSTEAINGAFDLRRFGSDVRVYVIGQGLLLLFGFILAFIVPKYLSIEGYGNWQLFVLYSSYVGILHLGYIDGILVRWAGKDLSEVSGEINTAFIFLLVEQIAIIVPLSVFLYFLLSPPFQWIGLMILAYTLVFNLATFFISTTQAVRKFRLLTVMNVGRGVVFLLIIGLLFIIGYQRYYLVISAFIISYIVSLLGFAFWFRKYLHGKMPSISSLRAYGKQNITIGIFVLLGNFIAILFMTIDRLMVSSFFTLEQFAIYAFALMVTMVAYTFVEAVSRVLFPYLSASTTELRTRVYRLGKPTIILFWAAILIIYFPLTKLIEFYLPDFVTSLPLLQILLCTVSFGSLIRILHVNYFKAYRKQRRYFLLAIIALALSAILNLSAIIVWGTLESVAMATLISFGIWYIMNELSLKSLVDETTRGLWKALLTIGGYLCSFWLASFLGDWFITQMFIYMCLYFLVSWFLLRNELKELVLLVARMRQR